MVVLREYVRSLEPEEHLLDLDRSKVSQSFFFFKGGTGALGAALASMAKLTTPVLCVDPSKEMLEVVEKIVNG